VKGIMARPSKYSSVNKEQLKILCLKGFTDKEMAAFFKINELTLNRWKKQYPEFCKSLKEAKEEADAKVEKSLFERANGYTHKAVKFFQHGAKIISQEYDEHYPPDPTSMIFWLKNRQPAKWRDKQDGDLNVNIAQIIFKVINNEKRETIEVIA